MYSVNIDKLMDIDSEKKESLVQIAHNITEALSSGKSVAVIGGKVDTFRIAYSIMEAGNKVLFVDGDITSDVFLGKYKLGKNARGVMDYLKNPDEDYELVCVTNHKELDIIFTGITEDGIVTQEEKEAGVHDSLIAAGQYTICWNLLEYIETIKKDPSNTNEHHQLILACEEQLRKDWEKFQKDPLCGLAEWKNE